MSDELRQVQYGILLVCMDRMQTRIDTLESENVALKERVAQQESALSSYEGEVAALGRGVCINHAKVVRLEGILQRVESGDFLTDLSLWHVERLGRRISELGERLELKIYEIDSRLQALTSRFTEIGLIG
jgi:hypothetical protein